MKIISGERNKKEFLKMLAWIELCGSIGHTPKYFKVYVDGDGKARLKFDFDTKEDCLEYKNIKKEMLNNYNKKGEDLKEINFE